VGQIILSKFNEILKKGKLIENIMDPEKFKEKTKKVGGTTKVEVALIDFLDSEYEVEILSEQSTTPTGLLEVIRLKPRKLELPKFIFRWDENADKLDIDIYKKERLCKELWSEIGYNGHQTKKMPGEGKLFEANISIPNRHIFKGNIDVGLFMQLIIKDSTNLTDSIKVVHKKVKIEDIGGE
jgi:hypothetical protein